jgi:hypothetical protein
MRDQILNGSKKERQDSSEDRQCSFDLNRNMGRRLKCIADSIGDEGEGVNSQERPSAKNASLFTIIIGGADNATNTQSGRR